MKYKVGDKVRIKSLDWYNENKDDFGNIDINEDFTFYADRSRYCGKVFTISEVFDNCYSVKEDNNEYYWIDEMIEGLVEEDVDLIPKFGEYSDNEPLDVPTMTTEFVKEHGLPCPNGYIFKDENGNEILTSKIILEKKKKEYPKTHEEYCQYLGFVNNELVFEGDYRETNFPLKQWKRLGLINQFNKLLICRDVYWKIAGEEMGLGKPWEPDYSGTFEEGCPIKYVIYSVGTHILKGRKSCPNHILAFPTEEMRDAFYENFKEEIEFCKELL